MDILFIGGCEHGKIKNVATDGIPMRRVEVPYDPDDRMCLFTGPAAIVKDVQPAERFTYQMCSYVLRKVLVDCVGVGFVYVERGIKEEHLFVYLSEPFIVEKLRKVGLHTSGGLHDSQRKTDEVGGIGR